VHLEFRQIQTAYNAFMDFLGLDPEDPCDRPDDFAARASSMAGPFSSRAQAWGVRLSASAGFIVAFDELASASMLQALAHLTERGGVVSLPGGGLMRFHPHVRVTVVMCCNAPPSVAADVEHAGAQVMASAEAVSMPAELVARGQSAEGKVINVDGYLDNTSTYIARVKHALIEAALTARLRSSHGARSGSDGGRTRPRSAD
jgi:hypothetical protein